MNQETRFSIVVPVYNEEKTIGEFCAAARAGLKADCEILICYDFDEDSTLPALQELPADEKPEHMRLVRNDLGRGVRYAIEAGMRAAETPIVVVMMCDLSDEFSVVLELVSRAEQGAAVVCASRYMSGGGQVGGPWLKKTLSRMAGVSLYWLAGLPTHDATNSFKAYRSDYLKNVEIESQAGFSLGIELTVKAHFFGYRVEEVPTIWHDRSEGESRFRLFAWLPQYLRWYFWALIQRWFKPRLANRNGNS